MKYFRLLLLAATVSFAGCVGGVAVPTTLDQRIAAGYVTADGAAQATLRLLQTKKISPKEARQISDQLKLAKEGLDMATELMLLDIGASQSKLESQLKILQAIEEYLIKKGGGS